MVSKSSWNTDWYRCLLFFLSAILFFQNLTILPDTTDPKSQNVFIFQEIYQPKLLFKKLSYSQTTWLGNETILMDFEKGFENRELDYHNKEGTGYLWSAIEEFISDRVAILEPHIEKGANFSLTIRLLERYTSGIATDNSDQEGQSGPTHDLAAVTPNDAEEERTENHPMQNTLGIYGPQGFTPKVSSKGEYVGSGGNEPPKRSITEMLGRRPFQLPHQNRVQFVGRTRRKGELHHKEHDDTDDNPEDSDEEDRNAERW